MMATMTVPSDVANVTHVSNIGEALEIEDVLHETIETFITLGRNVHLLWYIIGFIGNAVSIKIWIQPQMYEICSYAMYLTSISVCDIVCLCLHIFYYVSFFWNVKSLQDPTLCETWTILYMIPQYVSLFLVIGFIIRNLLAISDPFLSNRYLPRQNAAKQIVGIVIFVTTLSFPLAFLWKMENRGDCERNNNRHLSMPTTDSPTALKSNDSQLILIYWLTDIGTYIPLITLVLSICIILKLRKSSEGQNQQKGTRRNSQAAKSKSVFQQSTLILLSVSFFRVLTYLPNTVRLILRRLGHYDPSKLPTVYSIDEAMTIESWVSYTRYASTQICCDLIENSHLALGVFIYMISSSQYRTEVMVILRQLLTLPRDLYERWDSRSDRWKCYTSETI